MGKRKFETIGVYFIVHMDSTCHNHLLVVFSNRELNFNRGIAGGEL
jgi:hypothetical protein